MNVSSMALSPSTNQYNAPAFWERLWRMSGVNFLIFVIAAYFIYGAQPQIGASSGELLAFYDGHRMRILIATIVSGMALLNLLWFVAALRTTLADAGQGGWGAAATASSAALGGMAFLLVAMSAAVAYSAPAAGEHSVGSGLSEFTWAAFVLSSFPRAMLIMSGTFGLWRARLISNGVFAAGVAVVILVLLGGTTWLSSGFWAPDGLYSRIVSPLAGIAWLLAVSGILLTKSPATRTGW